MKRLIPNIFPVLLIGLISCNEEGPANGQFLIISNAGNPVNGIVSTYSYPSKDVEKEVFRFSSTSYSAEVTAAILSGDELYVIRRDGSSKPDQVEIVNTTDWSNLRSINIPFVAYYSRIAVSHDKIFVTGSVQDGSMHLLVFNKTTLEKEDSIRLHEYAEIREIIAYEGKIFVSYNAIDANPFMIIVDGSSNTIMDEFELTDIIEDFIVDTEGNLMAFYNRGFLKINSTLTMETIEIPVGNVFYGPGRSSFGYQRKKNVVYYFSYAAQPAPEPFHFAAFQLSNQEPISIRPQFINATSLEFINDTNQIIIGSINPSGQGLVKLYDTDGEVEHNFFIPGNPLKILFRD
ncbi:MAG TPA: hypothetical protein VGK39_05565 [Cyclobacteriaceae bacterium]